MATKRKTTASRNKKEPEQAGMEGLSAIEILEADHRQVEEFFDEYEELDDANDKEQLAVKICTALQASSISMMPAITKLRRWPDVKRPAKRAARRISLCCWAAF